MNILLSISEELARARSKNDLHILINGRLKGLLPFDHGAIGIVNHDKRTYAAFLIDPSAEIANNAEQDTYFKEGYPVNNIVASVLEANLPVIIDLDNLVSAGEVPLYTRLNYEAGMKEIVAVALRTEERILGFFGMFSKTKNGFSKTHLKILQAVSNQLSIAVANILANEEILERENENAMLLALSSDITSCRTYEDVQDIISKKLTKYFHFEEVMICLNNSDNLTHKCYAHNVTRETMNHPDFVRGAMMKYFINDGVFNVLEDSTGPVIFDMDELVSRQNKPFYIDFWRQLNVKEIIGFPIRMNNECIGGATIYPKEKNIFNNADLQMAQAVFSYLGIALSNIRSFEKIKSQLEEIGSYKSQLEQENQYLQDQIKTAYNYEEIIGSGNGLQKVFQLISNVAPSDSTVLILGETGTGKELIAGAIHNSSPRRKKLMVKLNCATLPAQLIESELFGHERGSFTGAIERRIGKFELANGGTLFLDEIGEITQELQAKLLRAIQEKEIERIGGKSVIRTDVRIIAASNRNLKQEVEAGRFRRDLFYRLNVFPITLPPLRERMEDIPVLVSHFINKFSHKFGKKIKSISPTSIHELMLYDWPGNIRELEHIIERSVLMTSGDIITEIHLLQGDKVSSDSPGEAPFQSLEENERAHILSALKKSNGKVGGAGGAAEILKVPPTTLHSKMKKFGIRKMVS